jgi:hypothetical protein
VRLEDGNGMGAVPHSVLKNLPRDDRTLHRASGDGHRLVGGGRT